MTLQKEVGPALDAEPTHRLTIATVPKDSTSFDRVRTAFRDAVRGWWARRPYGQPAWMEEISMEAAQHEEARR